MALPQFIFGGNTGIPTAEELARQRALAQALLSRAGGGASSIGEGLGQLGSAIGGRIAQFRADRGQNRADSAAGALWQRLLPGAGAMPSAVGEAMAQPPVAPSPPGPMGTLAARPETQPTMIAGGGGSDTLPGGTKGDFIARMLPYAKSASAATGVDPRIILAQAALESAWGRKAPGNNYFGIKSHGKAGGQTFATTEEIGGKNVHIRDSFRAYGSPGDSFAGYADFINTNKRYRPLKSAQGLDAQIAALQASGYATDSKYGQKIAAIAQGIPGDFSFTPEPGLSAPMPPQPQIMAAGGPPPDAMPQPTARPMSAYDRMMQTAIAKGQGGNWPGIGAPGQNSAPTGGGSHHQVVGVSVSGRPLYSQGTDVYSEKTVTFPIGNKWYTFPSVDGNGNIMSEDAVREYVIKNGPIDPITGEKFPAFNSLQEAENYARTRSSTRVSQPAPMPGNGLVQGGSGASRAQQLLQAIGDPAFQHLQPIQQRFLLEEYQREADAANPDPVKELERRKLQYEVDHLGQPKPPDPLDAVKLEREKLELENLRKPKPGYRILTPEEKQQRGIPPDAPVQMGPDGKIEVIDDLVQKPPEMPKSRTVRRGDKEVTQEWDAATGTFKDVAEGPAWAPKGNGITVRSPDGTEMIVGGEGGGPNIPAEMGSRIGLGRRFLEVDLPDVIKKIESGAATGPVDFTFGKFGRGDAGEVQRRMASGVDALRRNLTGAGMSISEAGDYADRYLPQWSDDADTLKRKALSLQADLEAVDRGAIEGKSGNLRSLLPGDAIWGKTIDESMKGDNPPANTETPAAATFTFQTMPEYEDLEGPDGKTYKKANGIYYQLGEGGEYHKGHIVNDQFVRD